MTNKHRLRIGYIPLVDAAALIVAVDKGFAGREGLAVDLVREVSWSNVHDKLNIGLFDAAHLLSPVAIASSLGLGHVRVPLLAPFNLGTNGNAVTVTPQLYRVLADAADDDLADPMVSARALARVVAARRRRNAEPLALGMTFPFSNHNYQLRFWMAAGGVDPDEDVRLVVLPPPYMVDSLASAHVDGFCVGAPWNSVAVDIGVGRILHFGCDIVARCSEKVLAVRAQWASRHPHLVEPLVRALDRAASFVADPVHRDEVANLVGTRIGVAAEVVRRTLAGKLKVSPDGAERSDARYLLIGGGAARPDPMQAAWLYAQMVRWGQAPISPDHLAAARAVFSPDTYDAVLGSDAEARGEGPADGIGAFAGPAFDPARIADHVVPRL
jgi:ABC-type nitrate/sulfonate/bicarbonate transport system substrate-binding protein